MPISDLCTVGNMDPLILRGFLRCVLVVWWSSGSQLILHQKNTVTIACVSVSHRRDISVWVHCGRFWTIQITHFLKAHDNHYPPVGHHSLITLKVDESGLNGRKWMKVEEMAGNGWKWIIWMKVDDMDEVDESGWNWMKSDENEWKWMNVDESGWTGMNMDEHGWTRWKWMKVDDWCWCCDP